MSTWSLRQLRAKSLQISKTTAPYHCPRCRYRVVLTPCRICATRAAIRRGDIVRKKGLREI